MPKRYPPDAIRRECPVCHQGFKPMTQRLFDWIWRSHLDSIRHRRYVALAEQKTKQNP
jgi:hypothetical protein